MPRHSPGVDRLLVQGSPIWGQVMKLVKLAKQVYRKRPVSNKWGLGKEQEYNACFIDILFPSIGGLSRLILLTRCVLPR